MLDNQRRATNAELGAQLVRRVRRLQADTDWRGRGQCVASVGSNALENISKSPTQEPKGGHVWTRQLQKRSFGAADQRWSDGEDVARKVYLEENCGKGLRTSSSIYRTKK